MPLYVTNRHACGPWWVRGPVQKALSPLRPIHLREFKERNPYGVVYAILFDSGLVKIGSTHNPRTRIQSQTRVLATYGDRKTREVAVSFPCSNFVVIERKLHKGFAAVRHRGELFNATIDQVGTALVGIEVAEEAIDISVVLKTGRKVRVFEGLTKFTLNHWIGAISDRVLRWGPTSAEYERVVALARANTDNRIDPYINQDPHGWAVQRSINRHP